MRKRFNRLLSESKNNMVLTQLRERLLRIMLYSSFVVGTILFVLAGIPRCQKGAHIATIFIYGVLYIWTILITFDHRLPLPLRAIGWLGMLFAFGIINLVDSGFNVDSGLFLITFIAMAILLMDLPAGLVALGAGFGRRFHSGSSKYQPEFHITGGFAPIRSTALDHRRNHLRADGGAADLFPDHCCTWPGRQPGESHPAGGELEQTNATLRMSEARYRTLVETSPDMVLLLDLQGNIIMSNQVGLTLFGYEHLDEVAGKNIVDFIAPDDRPRAAEAFQSILVTGGLKDFDILAIRKDGSTFFGEYSAALLMDEAGGPQAVIGVGRDITVRKEAERILQESKDALAVKVVETTVQLQQAASRLEELVSHGPTVIYSFRVSDHVVTYMSENVVSDGGIRSLPIYRG